MLLSYSAISMKSLEIFCKAVKLRSRNCWINHLSVSAKTMTDPKESKEKKFVERRKGGDRRVGSDRRVALERRHDSRSGSSSKKKNIRIWLRSLTNARLGVDRRKGERRQIADRRQRRANALLTKEEIADLLSS